jgi:hypothetical protein
MKNSPVNHRQIMTPDIDRERRQHDTIAHQQRLQHEESVQRNPHPDFKTTEALRPDWEEGSTWRYTKTRDPSWQWGQGGNDGGKSSEKEHVEINPYEEGRPPVYNYKLLISGIVPQPISLLSTVSADGKTSIELG